MPYPPMLLLAVSIGIQVKISVIIFMTIAAFCAFDANNLVPLIPPERDGHYGLNGVLTGSTAAFFGFIGFDEVRLHTPLPNI